MGPSARALTIAGSDSGGCAGIQADLRTFAALRVHGMTAITAVTAQNTARVLAVEAISPSIVQAQIRAVAEDIGVDAVKTGMIPFPETAELIALCLDRFQMGPLVVDPVMVSTSGDQLSSLETVRMMKESLFPRAAVVTPNVREAELLAEMQIRLPADYELAAHRIRALGASTVVIKGGDTPGSRNSVDYLLDADGLMPLASRRIETENTHGSGCSFAAAITAFLARGCSVRQAVKQAKEFVFRAIEASYSVGKGPGPLGHFFELWR